MKGDGVLGMGLALLAVAALLSAVMLRLPQAAAPAGGAAGSAWAWALVLAIGAFGFVGYRWLRGRLAGKARTALRPWARRRRALPPAPAPADRPPPG